jgi:hypothetical protein
MIYDALKIVLITCSTHRPPVMRRAQGQPTSKLGFYTPILKAFLTDNGLEAANLGMQVFGGHGYIKEHGMEQFVRDARINMIYARAPTPSRPGPAGPQGAGVDYLMYSGFVMMGYYWAVQAAKAEELLASGQGKESEDFYRSKVQTAEFYFERLMPRANAHRTGALAPTRSVMQLDNEHFAFG